MTERGQAQARRLAARLLEEPAPSALLSSPSQRATQTALVLGERLQTESLEVDAGLREIGCGHVDGWPARRVQELYPRHWADNSAQADPDFHWPGGESYREFRQRALAAVQAIARRYPARRVLVVTHAGVISQLVGWVHGESPARWERSRPGNASVTELRWGQRVEVVRFGEEPGPSSGRAP